jgi:hypothetical protein
MLFPNFIDYVVTGVAVHVGMVGRVPHSVASVYFVELGVLVAAAWKLRVRCGSVV